LVRDVLDDAARDRLASNIVAHVRAGVVEPVLSRVKEYWRHVDPGLGARVAKELEA
jgi:catalase